MAPPRRSRSRTRVRSRVRLKFNRHQGRRMTVKMNHVGRASAQKAIRRQTRCVHLRKSETR